MKMKLKWFFRIIGLVVFVCAETSLAQETYRFYQSFPIFKHQWYFKQPKGITIDRDGFIYIADTLNDRVQKFNSDGDFVAQWGRLGSGLGEFNQPYDIAADNDGYVYVTDSVNKRVQKFASDGRYIAVWDNNFDLPTGIASDIKGDIYVTDTNLKQIRKFTKDGKYLLSWGKSGNGDGEFKIPRGIATIMNDGKVYVYVADEGNNTIQKFDEYGNFKIKWDIEYPGAVETDMKNFVYVTDRRNHQVRKFDSNGTPQISWGGFGTEDQKFNQPSGIAIQSSGAVIVSDTKNDRLQKFSENGVFIAKFGRGILNSPDGIAVSSDKNIYIADTDNHRILKFDSDFKLLREWGGKGKPPATGVFDSPKRIAVDKDGFVYVADTGNHRIQKFDSNGVFQSSWGKFGSGDEQFNVPYSIAVGSEFIYVADKGNSRIQKLDKTGKFIASLGNAGDEKLGQPEGVAVSDTGEVYVADTNNHCVKKFSSDGIFLQKWGKQGSNGLEFSYPGNITLNKEGDDLYMYVSDTENHRIQKIREDGVLAAIIGEEGSFNGQCKSPGATAIGPDGEVYVADNYNHRIEVFVKEQSDIKTKAIIVAGGGPFPGNRLWDATAFSANLAYQVLNYRGLKKDMIYYLSSDKNSDLDNNNEYDDIDGVLSRDDLNKAFIWASEGADRLIVYFVDHGGADSFRLSESDPLSSSELNGLLNSYYTNNPSLNKEIIFVYDACNSGSFADSLTSLNQNKSILITSTSKTSETGNAYFINQGTISFSSFFWSNISNGDSIREAFDTAEKNLSNFVNSQSPELFENGLLANQTFIGTGIKLSETKPVLNVSIGSVNPETNSVSIEVRPDDNSKITKIWAVLVSPDDSSDIFEKIFLNLPSVELLPTDQGVYRGTLNNISGKEAYKISVFYKDLFGNTFTADPQPVTGTDLKKYRAVLIAGWSSSEDRKKLIKQNIQLAYASLKFQGYNDEDIVIMDSYDIKSQSTPAYLKSTIESWNDKNTVNAVIYICGPGRENEFQMSQIHVLKSEDIDSFLDSLQQRIFGDVIFVYDGEYSGSFLPKMIPPGSKKRINIFSSSGKPAAIASVSFSGFFWQNVMNGLNLWKAFSDAKSAVRIINPSDNYSIPLMDDNGNGIGNDRIDGQLAMNTYIGKGIGIIRNDPQIASDIPEITLCGNSSAILQADNVNSTNAVQKVWAIITPPFRYASNQKNDEIVFTLEDNDVYQGTYSKFNKFGDYKVAIYASDTSGNISLAKSTTVSQMCGEDIFEPDNTPSQAKIVVINDISQHHNLNIPDKNGLYEDWTKFYGISGNTYEIKTLNRDGTCNDKVGIDIYDAGVLSGYALSPLQNDTCRLSWTCKNDGIYYVKLSSETQVQQYFLEINLPIAVLPGYIIGIVTDISGNPISGAVLTTDGKLSGISFQDGYFMIMHNPGTFNISVEATGNNTLKTNGITINEAGCTVLNLVLSPIQPPPPIVEIPPIVIEPPPQNKIPEAFIDADKTEIREGGTITFNGKVMDGDEPFTYQWFINGELKSAENVYKYTFNEAGHYEIKLTVTDSNGDSNPNPAIIYIDVKTKNKPDPYFSVEIFSSETINEGEPLSVNAMIKNGTPPFSYCWYIDGKEESCSKTTISEISFEKIFANVDNDKEDHIISIVVTDKNENNKPSIGYRTITVINNRPQISVQNISEVKAGKKAYFDLKIQGGNPPYSLNILVREDISMQRTYRFDSEGSYQIPLIFENKGDYTVIFEISDKDGDKGEKLITVKATKIEVGITKTFATIIKGELFKLQVEVRDGKSPVKGVLKIEGKDYHKNIEFEFNENKASLEQMIDYDGSYIISCTVIDSEGDTAVSQDINAEVKSISPPNEDVDGPGCFVHDVMF